MVKHTFIVYTLCPPKIKLSVLNSTIKYRMISCSKSMQNIYMNMIQHQIMLFLCFQGVAMPAMNNMLSKWIPVSERSRSLALVYSGMYLGSVVGLAFSPLLIQKFGWPSVFYSFGSLGSIWFALWLRKVSQLSLNFNEIYFMYLFPMEKCLRGKQSTFPLTTLVLCAD